MKKKLAVLITAAMLAASLAACGGSAASTADSKADEAVSEAESAAEEVVSEAESVAEEAVSEAESLVEEAESVAEETGAEAGEAAAEDSDWAYVEGNGVMKVGITMFAPMNYEEDNELVGFDTELTKAVCEKLGVEAEFIEINWDSKEIELNSKNIDCIWNGMCITEERKQNMSMTNPYLLNTQALVMKADREEEIMADVSGLNLVAEQGSTGEGKVDGSIPDDETVVVSAHEFFANTNYTPVDSMAKALMEVKAGTADLAIVDSVCALAMVGEGTDYDDMVVNLDNNFGEQEYGIAFRKGSDITEVVNSAIDELYADGTVAEIAAKYGLTDILISR